MFDIVNFANNLGGMALTLPRIAAAFLILPFMSKDTVPVLVRNSYFVTLALVAFPIVSQASPQGIDTSQWPWIVVKEAFIGICIGFVFGLTFWAIETAGNLIDTKVGSNNASLMDPLTGHDTSLTADFLQQFAAWLFLASGGMLVFLDLLLGSYAVWPVEKPLPALGQIGMNFFIGEFAGFAAVALLMAAPALIILSLADLALGLMNRFAQQLNVLAISMAIKSWLATLIILVMLTTFVEFTMSELTKHQGLVKILERVF